MIILYYYYIYFLSFLWSHNIINRRIFIINLPQFFFYDLVKVEKNLVVEAITYSIDQTSDMSSLCNRVHCIRVNYRIEWTRHRRHCNLRSIII